MHRLPASLLFAIACALSSCVLDTSSPGVYLATNPPGARVHVDGYDTGFATPCAIALETSKPHDVTFELEGYASATRHLVPNPTWEVVPWSDGDVGASRWRFPIFLTFQGFFFPFRHSNDLAPSRVYVPLEVATDAE
jgi:hypothetical protein